MNIAEAKNRLTIPTLWEMRELPGEPGSSCCSPLREDHNPSFWVSEDGLHYYDHGEGKGGDAVDFLERATGLSKAAACRVFIELASGRPVDPNIGIHTDRSDASSATRVKRTRSDKPLRHIDNLPKFVENLDNRHGRELVTCLASLRSLRKEAVIFAHNRGLLKFCYCKARGYQYGFDWIAAGRFAAWVITDKTLYCAQVRWLDGSEWLDLPGEPKSKTWQGSSGKWPIGIYEALPYPLIVMVEGSPDVLAAHHFIELAGAEAEIAVVGMMGAGMPIHQEALPLFRGKRVRIIPDADDPGREAAEKWATQLLGVGTEVDAFDLGGLRMANDVPVKDLNDCCNIHPDDASELERMFSI